MRRPIATLSNTLPRAELRVGCRADHWAQCWTPGRTTQRGLACLRHSVVRLLLWRARAIPWNYPHFLDYAAEQILLCKIGAATFSFTACCWSTLHRWTAHHRLLKPGRKHNRHSQFPDG